MLLLSLAILLSIPKGDVEDDEDDDDVEEEDEDAEVENDVEDECSISCSFMDIFFDSDGGTLSTLREVAKLRCVHLSAFDGIIVKDMTVFDEMRRALNKDNEVTLMLWIEDGKETVGEAVKSFVEHRRY